MDRKKYVALNEMRRSLQGSLNYWNNAVEGLTQHAAKAKTGKQRQDTLHKIAYCKQRMQTAHERLHKIKQEMTALDPGGSMARQIHATQTSRDKAKREIRQLEEVLAHVDQDTKEHEYWRSRLDKKRQRLAVLEERLQQLRESQPAKPEQPRPQADADTLAILARIKNWEEQLNADAAAAASLQPALAPAIAGLRQAIDAATRNNNPRLIEQLQNSLAFLTEMREERLQ